MVFIFIKAMVHDRKQCHPLRFPIGPTPLTGAFFVGRSVHAVLRPCMRAAGRSHRALGAEGSLTGYAGGLDRKAALLLSEGITTGPMTGQH